MRCLGIQKYDLYAFEINDISLRDLIVHTKIERTGLSDRAQAVMQSTVDMSLRTMK